MEHFIDKATLETELLIELLWHTANIIANDSLIIYFKEQGLHSAIMRVVQKHRQQMTAECWRLVLWIMSVMSRVIESNEDQNQFLTFIKETAPIIIKISR